MRSDADKSGANQMPQTAALVGGIANAHRIQREAAGVRRPLTPQSPAVHAFLRHLEAEGVSGVPRVLGIEGDSEYLTFLNGMTPGDPPGAAFWSQPTLSAVANKQFELHEAAQGFVWPSDVPPGVPYLPADGVGSLVCHNDLNCQNAVFDDDGLVGFIDFDYAAPADRLFDIAYMARHWVPFRHPDDLDAELDGTQVERFGLIAAIHRLTRAERRRVLALAITFFDVVLDVVRARAAANTGGFRAIWDAGYERSNRRSQSWLDAERTRLVGG